MVMVRKQSTQEPTPGPERFEGGPVFLPPRKPSAWAQALMASLAQAQGLGEDAGVTGYDEIWFGNRSQTS